MSRKLTSKCDGCGVEHVDDNAMGIASILGAGRRRGTDNWGNLTVASSGFPAMFDLCEACTKRVVALLELEILDTRAIVQRYGGLDGLGGLGGHAVPFMPGDRMAPPWTPPSANVGALTPEDLKALGIQVPGVTPADAVGLYECPGCGTLREGPVPGYACGVCHHQD